MNLVWHLGAFDESQNSATLVAVAALADQALTISGDDLFVPAWAPLLRYAYALGGNVTRAQLRSPSIRARINDDLELTPLDVAAEPTGTLADSSLLQLGIPLVVDEALNALAAEDATSAARSIVFVWLDNGARIPMPAGIIRTFRFTRGNVATANVWDNAVLTASVPAVIPEGEYCIVGARGTSTGMQAFRFVSLRPGPGSGSQMQARPGTIGYDTATEAEGRRWRRGGLGEAWGYFSNRALPTVDVLAVSTDTDVVLQVDVIKVR